jgi:hypothetical protein
MRDTKVNSLSNTEETILGWINSCQTVEQLEVCNDAVTGLVRTRRFPHEPEAHVKNAAIRLQMEIMEKREQNLFKQPVLEFEAINS